MDASAAQIVAAVIGSGGVVSVLWAWGNANKNEYVNSLLEQIKTYKANALSSETRAIAADQAKSVAEKRAGELEMKVAYLKQQLRTAVEALDVAQVQIDPSTMIGGLSLPPGEDEHSAVLYIAAEKRSQYFLGARKEQEEAERRRQRPLNPEAERRERERVDMLARQYVVDSDKPRR